MYRNNDDDDVVLLEVLAAVELAAAAAVELPSGSLSLFRKKEMATPKLSVRFIKNLFFLSIGADPTATRCTLILFRLVEEGGLIVVVGGVAAAVSVGC